MLWGGARAPFTLVGGYLGAGKTTILNHLLAGSTDRRLVVLVNDVGSVNVDAALIADHDGETLTLTNGCVCCGIADDFNETLEQVRSLAEPPDHIVMEMSGVGEPARLAPWANTAGFRLDGIIVAVDAEQVSGQIARRYVGDTVTAQLAAADVIALTKVDLTTDAGAGARQTVEACTSAPIIDCIGGDLDPAVLLGVYEHEPVREPPAGSPVAYRTATRPLPTVSFDELVALVDALPASMLRAKGLVPYRRGAEVECAEVHLVGPRRIVRRRPELTPPSTGEIVTISLADQGH